MTERTQVAGGSPYEETVGFSRAVRVGAHVYVAGTAPVRPDGEVDPDPATQARRCWEIALDALDRLGGDVRPASTMLVVAALLDPRWVVEVELDAVIDPGAAGDTLPSGHVRTTDQEPG